MFASPAIRRPAGHIASRQPLTDDQLRATVPSIYADAAHESRSARYAYIPTADILQALRAEGFAVYSATQSRTRIEGRDAYTKHLLRLRHASVMSRPAVVGESVPEIVLVNSHDGTSSYQMMGGIYRYVCANGMTVPDSTVQTVRVPHTGQVRDRVTAGAYQVLDGLTRVIDDRDSMRAVTLNRDESRVFAAAALQLRYDDDTPAPIRPEQLLTPRRIDDRAPDLWTTFNVVQENTVKGGLRGRSATGTRHTTRAVTGIDQDTKLNRALWTLAEEMRRLKGAA